MKIFSTLCCAAVALCGAIYAQSTSDHLTVHFNLPVMVGETQLPAGDRDIQVIAATPTTLSSTTFPGWPRYGGGGKPFVRRQPG